MELRKNYRNDQLLRSSFNHLAEETFGLNFEAWYQNGFWGENFNPYSMVDDGRVVANVSLNRTDFRIDGHIRKVYQLGTVMTAKDYRNRGLIREIMAEIDKDTADADGIYLFANDSVLDFYPKFGFTKSMEHLFSRQVCQSGPCRMERIPMEGPEGWNRLSNAMRESKFQGACDMVKNEGLLFFYVSQFMRDCVYYDRLLDTWVIAELEEGRLLLHNVFSSGNPQLDDVIASFGTEVTEVVLGFTPIQSESFSCREFREDDCTFFVKGELFRDFGQRKLRIPSLSHA